MYEMIWLFALWSTLQHQLFENHSELLLGSSHLDSLLMAATVSECHNVALLGQLCLTNWFTEATIIKCLLWHSGLVLLYDLLNYSNCHKKTGMLSHPLENCFAAAFAGYGLCLPNTKVTGFWAQYINLVLTLKEVGWRPWTHKPETSWKILELRPRTLKQSVACSIKNQSGEHGSHYQAFSLFPEITVKTLAHSI